MVVVEFAQVLQGAEQGVDCALVPLPVELAGQEELEELARAFRLAAWEVLAVPTS